MRFLLRGLVLFSAVALFLVVVVWLFLSSSLLSSPRTAFVEGLLSDELGRDVLIEDDVRIGIGRTFEVSTTGLALPSASDSDVNLAQIDRLEFDVSAKDLWKGQLSLSNFTVGVLDMQGNLIAILKKAQPAVEAGIDVDDCLLKIGCGSRI
ncbi:hypothetical protein [Ruegeria lacuscaerulensis]|uniref:hypothetical protein n=1 Tax=Ruegeria lacuscaerulensis TaxID=55218 RepID=UPI00147DB3E2|nr:hypothetical protein [Ruegeria lacuscaerulensis]